MGFFFFLLFSSSFSPPLFPLHGGVGRQSRSKLHGHGTLVSLFSDQWSTARAVHVKRMEMQSIGLASVLRPLPPPYRPTPPRASCHPLSPPAPPPSLRTVQTSYSRCVQAVWRLTEQSVHNRKTFLFQVQWSCSALCVNRLQLSGTSSLFLSVILFLC